MAFCNGNFNDFCVFRQYRIGDFSCWVTSMGVERLFGGNSTLPPPHRPPLNGLSFTNGPTSNKVSAPLLNIVQEWNFHIKMQIPLLLNTGTPVTEQERKMLSYKLCNRVWKKVQRFKINILYYLVANADLQLNVFACWAASCATS